MNQLGNTCIASGDGWYLTQSEQEWQLILYNYAHYDNIYRYRYRRLEHPEDAYSVFETGLSSRKLPVPRVPRSTCGLPPAHRPPLTEPSCNIWPSTLPRTAR